MKIVRILLPLALLLIAVPSFAICGRCQIDGCCQKSFGEWRCRPTIDGCEEVPLACAVPDGESVSLFASEFQIASVEVTTPATRTVTEQKTRIAAKEPKVKLKSPRTR